MPVLQREKNFRELKGRKLRNHIRNKSAELKTTPLTHKRKTKIPGQIKQGYVLDTKRAFDSALKEALDHNADCKDLLYSMFMIGICKFLATCTKKVFKFLLVHIMYRLAICLRYFVIIMQYVKTAVLILLFAIPILGLLACGLIFFTKVFIPLDKSLYGDGVFWHLVSICHDVTSKGITAIAATSLFIASAIMGSTTFVFVLMNEFFANRKKSQASDIIKQQSIERSDLMSRKNPTDRTLSYTDKTKKPDVPGNGVDDNAVGELG